ncbi:hypothetical protein QE410_001030 [Microbacterium sp. SORGH_AS 1204]|nr:hypothetical protein [Microbacterium sp. SORGH_AS_1204]
MPEDIVLRHAVFCFPAGLTPGVLQWVSLSATSEEPEGTPMNTSPRIRTMDALGLLVLRHREFGCRGPAARSKALSA